MTTTENTAVSANRPIKKRPPPRTVHVKAKQVLTTSMVRITFAGDQLAGFTSKGVAEHFRIYLPDAVTGELVLPVEGPDGYTFPEDKTRPISRAYTPRRWDPVGHELDVDILLHEDGPGSAWAAEVEPGDLAVISGQPGGAYTPDDSATWYLIGGDHAALPAIGTLVEKLPPHVNTHVFVEVTQPSETQQLTSPSRMAVNWLYPDPIDPAPGHKLSSVLSEFPLPSGNGKVWIACEASIMRSIKRHFLEDCSLDRTDLHAQGYWKAGATNHSDSDMGEDV